MGCGCNKAGRYKVSFPNGKSVVKNSKTAAELAKAKVPGATIEKLS